MNRIEAPKIQTEYTITKKRCGRILQEVKFHNIILNNFIDFGLTQDLNMGCFRNCKIGSGSTVPTVNDTDLAQTLWTIAKNSAQILSTSQDKSQRSWLFTYIVPANTQYEGTVREIGIYGNKYQSYTHVNTLITRALITDAEGMPIEIEKTYLDELDVTVKFTIIRPLWASGFTWPFMIGPFSRDDDVHGLLNSANATSSYSAAILSQSCPELFPTNRGVTTGLTPFSCDKALQRYSGSFEFSGDAGREGASGAYTDYINSICFGSTGAPWVVSFLAEPSIFMAFPNADVFPVTTLENLALGSGDGTTTDFAITIPAWIANSEVVYIDGVAQVRGVDYLVDNLHNLGKFSSVTLGNFIDDFEFNPCSRTNDTYLFGANARNAGAPNSGISVTKDTPIVIHYNNRYAFSNKLNYFILGNWQASANVPSGAALVFYYSIDDAETWVEFGRINHTSNNNYFNDATEHTLSATVNGVTDVKITLEDTASDAYIWHNTANSKLGYVGEYCIRFMNAPQANAVLTIDIDIDRPWKDSETYIQISPVIDFGV